MNAHESESDLANGKAGEVNDKSASTINQDFEKLTKQVNRIADKLFYWFVFLCSLVLLIVWLTAN